MPLSHRFASLTSAGSTPPSQVSSTQRLSAVALAALALTLGACASAPDGARNTKPRFLGDVRQISYDGVADDLLTAGLGKSGLGAPTAPAYADPLKPTAAELRRTAIHTNYRALVDMTEAGGYGRLFGPNVDANGRVTSDEGKVAGTEYLAFSDGGSGRQNVTLMVQVPTRFDPANACMVTATSSGSRGVYGGMLVAEWGLKRGCAVAFTDKGTGGAGHDLASDTVPLIDGTRATAEAAGKQAAFNAQLSEAQRASYNAASPNRLAFKHAHSQQNPEKDWGQHTLRAIEMGFYALNERYGEALPGGGHSRRLTPANTIVIASSLSNGGGAAIAALEQDTQGLISGLAVSEPQVELPATPAVRVQRGGKPVPSSAKTLMDYTIAADLYQACAALAPSLANTPFAAALRATLAKPELPIAPNRCESLRRAGLLNAEGGTEALAEAALAKLIEAGWEPESAPLHASLAGFEVAHAVAVSYINAYSRASVSDNLCGYSLAATNASGAVQPIAAPALAGMFATGNGVPPSTSVQIINNTAVNGPANGPVRDLLSVNAGGVADGNLAGVLCMRDLLAGKGAMGQRLVQGVNETRLSGKLRGKPALIVHGRDDALLPVNHTSRPYAALNRLAEGERSQLRYIEVTNAQHFDGFIGLPSVLPGYDSRYVPLHVYLHRALDTMYAHLKHGQPLPPSQVVRTVPRGGEAGKAPPLAAANLPAFAAQPAPGDVIRVTAGAIDVPE